MLSFGSLFSQNHNLELYITNCRATGGNLKVAAFKGEHDFKAKENASFRKSVEANDSSLIVHLWKIPQGKYAIAVFHDQNKDNKLNTNDIGIPSEGFGFSGNYSIFKKPKFKDCSFELSSDTSIIINMHYLWN